MPPSFEGWLGAERGAGTTVVAVAAADAGAPAEGWGAPLDAAAAAVRASARRGAAAAATDEGLLQHRRSPWPCRALHKGNSRDRGHSALHRATCRLVAQQGRASRLPCSAGRQNQANIQNTPACQFHAGCKQHLVLGATRRAQPQRGHTGLVGTGDTELSTPISTFTYSGLNMIDSCEC